MKTVREILIEARALIADPVRWTQGAMARDALRESVASSSAAAVCWCAEGAAFRAGGPEGGPRAIAAMTLGGHSPWWINDTGAHADALALFDHAIAAEPT